MVTYKEFLSEARFDVSGATARMSMLPTSRPVATYPVQTAATPIKAAPLQATPLKAVPTTPTLTAPRIGPAVTTRNVPTPISASKNGRLQPAELTRVGKYKAGPAGRQQWYGDDAYLAPDAAQAFIAAQQAFGQPIQINSAYRNLEHQQGLQGKYAVVAAVGKSRHGLGKALDLQPGTPGYGWMKANGPQFGWHFAGISKDPYHFEYRA